MSLKNDLLGDKGIYRGEDFIYSVQCYDVDEHNNKTKSNLTGATFSGNIREEEDSTSDEICAFTFNTDNLSDGVVYFQVLKEVNVLITQNIGFYNVFMTLNSITYCLSDGKISIRGRSA